jgi:hypothetical protein
VWSHHITSHHITSQVVEAEAAAAFAKELGEGADGIGAPDGGGGAVSGGTPVATPVHGVTGGPGAPR